jgi:LPS export ABC transporter permease LptG
LYRIAAPMLVCAVIAGGVLFALDESILGQANQRAEFLLHVMRGNPADTFDIVDRHWAVSDDLVYHYNAYNPRLQRMLGLEVFEFSDNMSYLKSRTVADRADFSGDPGGVKNDQWKLRNGWTRHFAKTGEVTQFSPFVELEQRYEEPSYFGSERPDPEFMTYSQLRTYTEQLQAAGFDVLQQQVALARKVSFPFVTLIMTLIAVPFAMTTGRSGAMAGLGVGIALAITYWTATSIFAALGSGGMVAPVLAAWAPNMLFGAGAAYLLLTVRT